MKRKTLALLSIGLLTATCPFSYAKTENALLAEATTETLHIKGAGGMLPVVIQKPVLREGDTCPVAIILHGFMANKEYPLVTTLADKLQAQGFATVRFDFNGHGESYGEFQDMTVLKEVEDAKAVVKYLQAEPYTQSINLIGHSQGGVVTSLVAGELGDQIHSIVLFAPAAILEDQSAAGMIMGVRFDTEHVPDYVEVFGHRVGRGYILEARKLNIYKRASNYQGNACIIHGLEDKVVPFAYGERYHELYKNSEIHLLENENHGFEVTPEKATDIAVEYLVEKAS